MRIVHKGFLLIRVIATLEWQKDIKFRNLELVAEFIPWMVFNLIEFFVGFFGIGVNYLVWFGFVCFSSPQFSLTPAGC